MYCKAGLSILDTLQFGLHRSPFSVLARRGMDFVEGSPSCLPLPSPPEICLIHLNLSLQKVWSLTILAEDRKPDQGHCLEDGRVTQPELGCNLPDREFQLKTLDDPQPLLVWNPKPVDPPPGEVMECISTSLTSEVFTPNPVYLIPITPYAETTVVFPK